MNDVETPSGKGAGDENFPVGSWLLPAAHRPHVMAFYDFVRAADDIADHADLGADDKLARLGVFERALLGDEAALAGLPKAGVLRASLETTGVTDGIEITVVEGPDHYLYGEETALLEVIEGEDPLPRHLPPYQYGLFTTSPQFGWSAGTDDSPGGPTEPSDNPALVNAAFTNQLFSTFWGSCCRPLLGQHIVGINFLQLDLSVQVEGLVEE